MNKDKTQNEVPYVLLILAMIFVGFKVALLLFAIFLDTYKRHPYLTALAILAIAGVLLYFIAKRTKNIYLATQAEKQITNGKGEDSVFAGFADKKKIYINQSFRRMHAQVVGTTNAGKTESVIIPWAIDDIEKGRGLVIIDGKADRQLLDKLYSYAVRTGRASDFRTLSLSDHTISATYNPLIGPSVDQITEKIINSFQIENEYYRATQFDILRSVLEIFREANEIPNFIKLRQAITDPRELQLLAQRIKSPLLLSWATDFINMNKEKRKEQVSGLVSNLGFFTTNEVAQLFNTSNPMMSISEAMNKNQILFFQLPVLKSPILGKAIAKMVLQDVQGAVSERHASSISDHPFFSIYLDDFTEYLTPQFVSLLNKSRSANVGVVFSHQAIGDLEKLGPEVKNQILTNSNLKIFMRTNEPDSAEYFAKTVGTREAQKITLRQKEFLFGSKITREGSVRSVEEFVYHPNVFKHQLGLGDAVVILPHRNGSKTVKLHFIPRLDVPAVKLPIIEKAEPEILKPNLTLHESQSPTLASLAVRGV